MSHEITLHHLNASRSQRLFWLLEELDLPYNVRVHFRTHTRQAPKSLKEVSEFGKAPVLELDGETLTESGYIIERLLKLAPSSANVESPPSNDSTFWNHFAEGSLMSHFQFGAMIQATSGAWLSGQIPIELNDGGKEAITNYAGWFNEVFLRSINDNNLQQIEDFLSKHPGQYFSGTDKPGAGDFQMFFPFYSLTHGSRKGVYKLGPATTKYWEMVMARPAVKKAMERLAKEEENAKAKI